MTYSGARVNYNRLPETIFRGVYLGGTACKIVKIIK